MLTVFWNMKSPIIIDFLKKGVTVKNVCIDKSSGKSWLIYWMTLVFLRLFTRPSLWRYRLMVICEGPSSTDNVRVLVFGCCSTISNRAPSSITEGRPDLALSSNLPSPSSKRLDKFCTTHSWTIHVASTSLISFPLLLHSIIFSSYSFKMALMAILFPIHYQRCKINN